jgi:hypothetical protein
MKREWLHKSAYELSNEDLFYYSELTRRPKLSLFWLYLCALIIASFYNGSLRWLFLGFIATCMILVLYSLYRIQVKFGVKS